MKFLSASSAILLSVVLAAASLHADESELAALRAKAEKGNAIAQYNLGLSYAEGRGTAVDNAEAFVWLSLAMDNGARGQALNALKAKMNPADIETAQQRLANRRAGPSAPVSETATSIIEPPAPAIEQQLTVEKKELSAELSQAWKEIDSLKTELAKAREIPASKSVSAENSEADKKTRALIAAMADLDLANDAKAKLSLENKELGADKTRLENLLIDAQRIAVDSGVQLAALKSQLAAQAAPSIKDSPAYPDLSAQVQTLQAELAAAKAELNKPVATVSNVDQTDLAKELAETQSKLEMALRAYTLLQNDRDNLGESAAKSTASASADRDALSRRLTEAESKISALVADNQQLSDSLAALQRSTSQTSRDYAGQQLLLRQVRGSNTVLAQENYQLKTALARDPSAIRRAATAAAAPGRAHAVVGGDSLSKLSQQYYGTPNRWQEIYQANRDVLTTDGVLRLNTTLRIP